jgi:hypothetical protein
MNTLEFKLKKPFSTFVQRNDGISVKIEAKNIEEWTKYIVDTTAEFAYTEDILKQIIEYKSQQKSRIRLERNLLLFKHVHVLLCYHFNCRAGSDAFKKYMITRLDYYNIAKHPRKEALEKYNSLLPLVTEKVINDFSGIKNNENYYVANEYIMNLLETGLKNGTIVVYNPINKQYIRYKIESVKTDK